MKTCGCLSLIQVCLPRQLNAYLKQDFDSTPFLWLILGLYLFQGSFFSITIDLLNCSLSALLALLLMSWVIWCHMLTCVMRFEPVRRSPCHPGRSQQGFYCSCLPTGLRNTWPICFRTGSFLKGGEGMKGYFEMLNKWVESGGLTSLNPKCSWEYLCWKILARTCI